MVGIIIIKMRYVREITSVLSNLTLDYSVWSLEKQISVVLSAKKTFFQHEKVFEKPSPNKSYLRISIVIIMLFTVDPKKI
jgi:hypothetical protein